MPGLARREQLSKKAVWSKRAMSIKRAPCTRKAFIKKELLKKELLKKELLKKELLKSRGSIEYCGIVLNRLPAAVAGTQSWAVVRRAVYVVGPARDTLPRNT